jgi:hypothetical protein
LMAKRRCIGACLEACLMRAVMPNNLPSLYQGMSSGVR